MNGFVTNIFAVGIGIVVLGTGLVLLFAYFVKLRDAFVACLHGMKVSASEREFPRWRKVIQDWEERNPRFVSIIGHTTIAFLVAAAAWGYYTAHASEVRNAVGNGLLVAILMLGAAPWWLWLVAAGAVLWAWSYRLNRQRQQAMIELLAEIREKLG